MLSQLIDKQLFLIKNSSGYKQQKQVIHNTTNHTSLHEISQGNIDEIQVNRQHNATIPVIKRALSQISLAQSIQSQSLFLITQKRKHICTQCNKSFLKNAHLLRHIQQRHQNNRSFICQYPECNKNFKRDSHLRRHVLSHTHIKPHKCLQCLMSFKHKHHLQRHVKSIHQKQLLKCLECDQKFIKKKSYQRHLQKIHKINVNSTIKSKNQKSKIGINQNYQDDVYDDDQENIEINDENVQENDSQMKDQEKNVQKKINQFNPTHQMQIVAHKKNKRYIKMKKNLNFYQDVYFNNVYQHLKKTSTYQTSENYTQNQKNRTNTQQQQELQLITIIIKIKTKRRNILIKLRKESQKYLNILVNKN